MKFSEQVWEENRDLYTATLNHPFNKALADGTLDQASFRHYIIQDAHYLVDYAKALAVTAGKASETSDIIQFASAARIAIEVERELHDSYMKQFDISPEVFAKTPKTLACDHYTLYLLATCWSASYPVAVAALLPCYWIYAEVGNAILAASKPGNPYQAWVDTYAGEEFQNEVKTVISIVDRIAEKASEETMAQMRRAYRKAAELELLFWDSAYECRSWPSVLNFKR